MDQQQSLELFERGREVWNSWADGLAAERRELQETGAWTMGGSPRNKETHVWHEKAKADFRGVKFSEWADFGGFRFPGDALFESAIFTHGGTFASGEFLHASLFRGVEAGALCVFSSVTFRGKADFHNATFHGEAHFHDATFSGNEDVILDDTRFMDLAQFGSVLFEANVSFDRATFSGAATFREAFLAGEASLNSVRFTRHAIFTGSEFLGGVSFDRSVFEDAVYFGGTSFRGWAGFSAVRGKAVMLDHPEFNQVPDFTGAHFEEAPMLDDVELEPEEPGIGSDARSRVGLPERWRALRRLAVQGHDHESELLFFKREMVARRGTRDTWRHVWFWIGWTYQIASDFGQSATRPLLGLGTGILAFACLYALTNSTVRGQPFAQSIPCKAFSGDVRVAALTLSLHNTLPVAGIASTGRVQRDYACLYGLEAEGVSTKDALASGNSLVVPYGVVFAGICQSIVSAVLVFLVLLAVRNRFRIR